MSLEETQFKQEGGRGKFGKILGNMQDHVLRDQQPLVP